MIVAAVGGRVDGPGCQDRKSDFRVTAKFGRINLRTACRSRCRRDDFGLTFFKSLPRNNLRIFTSRGAIRFPLVTSLNFATRHRKDYKPSGANSKRVTLMATHQIKKTHTAAWTEQVNGSDGNGLNVFEQIVSPEGDSSRHGAEQGCLAVRGRSAARVDMPIRPAPCLGARLRAGRIELLPGGAILAAWRSPPTPLAAEHVSGGK